MKRETRLHFLSDEVTNYKNRTVVKERYRMVARNWRRKVKKWARHSDS
jgi:hypothetical protein